MWNDTLWNSGICEAVLIRNGKSIRLERIHLKTGVFVDAKCFLLFRQTDIYFFIFSGFSITGKLWYSVRIFRESGSHATSCPSCLPLSRSEAE